MAMGLNAWMIVSGVVTLLIGGAAAAVRHGNRRSQNHIDVLRARLDSGRVAVAPAEYDVCELDGLPVPVQRHFRAAFSSCAYVRYRTDFDSSRRYPVVVRWSDAMPLSFFAAETLVLDYLNGRILPSELHRAVVLAAKARLVSGLMPVLNETLCSEMDDHATAPPPWSSESVLRAAQKRSKTPSVASGTMGAHLRA